MQEKLRKIAIPALISCTCGVLTTVCLFALTQDELPWQSWLAMLLLLAPTWAYHLRTERAAHAVIGLMALLFIPFCGPIFSALLLLWSYYSPPPAEGQGETGAEDVRLFRLREPGPLKQILQPHEQESFIPAVTLLKSKNIEERRAAIEVLAQIGGPEQIKHLQACLEDEEREIYQLAHAKLSALHERYTDAIRKAQLDSVSDELLLHLIAYLRSGLLGEATQKFYRQQAVNTATILLKQSPKDVNLLATLAELYLENDELSLAADLFSRALEADPDNLKVHWGLAKIRCQQRDFDALRSHFEVLRQALHSETDVPMPKEFYDVLTWWFGDNP